jgi:hypothetical protein
VDGITLSILPEGNPGWRFVEPVRVPTGGNCTQPLPKATWPSSGLWDPTLAVSANFDRDNSPDKPAIDIQLTDSAQTGGSGGSVPNPKNSSPASPEAKAGNLDVDSEEASPGASGAGRNSPAARRGPTRSKSQARGRERPGEEKTPSSSLTPSPLAQSTAEVLRDAPDKELLRELFRRYGRVNASIVVKISDKDEEEIPVLTFGDVSRRQEP